MTGLTDHWPTGECWGVFPGSCSVLSSCRSRQEGHLCLFSYSVVGGRRTRLLHRAPPRRLSARLFCPREPGTLPEAPPPSPSFFLSLSLPLFFRTPSESAISLFHRRDISRGTQSPGIPKCKCVISELGQRHRSFTLFLCEAGPVGLALPVTSRVPAQ